MNQKHEFAIYTELSNEPTLGNLLIIDNPEFYHRVIRILRQQINDLIIIFDDKYNLLVKILEIKKNEIILQILKINENQELVPKISMNICMLKKDAFEEAIYFCAEIGANIIQPVITQKSHNKKFDLKDKERFKKIIIAGAEQSKNFRLPQIKDPVNFDNLINSLEKDDLNVYFDPAGDPIATIIRDAYKSNANILLMVGPEGDLTTQEKQILKESNFKFCALTKGILRAEIAIAISLGIFRSFSNSFESKLN